MQRPVRPFPQDVRGGLFDMDGTLIDSEKWLYFAWKIVCARYGHDYATFDKSRIMGLNGQDAAGIVARHFGIARTDDAFCAEWRKEARDLVYANVKLCPGVLETLTWFEERNLPKIVVTTSNESYSVKVLTLTGIRDRFSGLVSKDTMRDLGLRTKPAPDPYLHAANERLFIRPELCLAFEDSAFGVASAHAAGAYVIAVSHGDDAMRRALEDAGADVVLPDLTHYSALTRT